MMIKNKIDKDENVKVLFINPPYYRLLGQTYIYIPMGICCLASITKNAGYETFVYNMDVPPIQSETWIDYQNKYSNHDERDLILMNLDHDPLNVWSELIEVLNDIKPDVVGLTGLTPQIPLALKIADISKKTNPSTTVILGGTHATLRSEELIKETTIDYVFRGEAEEGILEFLDAFKVKEPLSKIKKIKGMTYKHDKKLIHNPTQPLIDINKYPMPAKDLFLFPERLQPKNMGLILTGRGCPFKCNFCASPFLSEYKVRKRSIKNIVDEIEFVVNTYKIDEFMFWEDTFIVGKERLRRFCDELKKRNLDIFWRCHTRLDTLNDEILDLIIANGCKQINVGIETGSEKMMKYINKKVSLEKIIEKLDLLREKNIAWSANFLIGYPEETPSDVEKTIKFIETHVRNHIAVNVCIPYPGTKFFDYCLNLGIIDDNKAIDWTLYSPQTNQSHFTKYLSIEQLNGYLKQIGNVVKPFMKKTPGTFSPCERL